MSQPTLRELDEQLEKLVFWERFALHLPRIRQVDIDIIKRDSPYDAVGQKLSIFSKWLERCPTASWQDVAMALEGIGENILSLQVRHNKNLSPLSSRTHHSRAQEEATVSQLTSEFRSVAMSSPTVWELDEQLEDLVYWERFAIHLPEITSMDIDIIRMEGPYDVVGQKFSLFKRWLERCPTASWQDVAMALERIGENMLALQVRHNKNLSPFSSHVHHSRAQEEATVLQLTSEFRSVAMSSPTVWELDEQLKELVFWEIFALHLPRISQVDIDIIKRDSPYGAVGQKLSIFSKWLERCPTASWQDVAMALEMIGEHMLSLQVRRNKNLSPFSSRTHHYRAQEDATILQVWCPPTKSTLSSFSYHTHHSRAQEDAAVLQSNRDDQGETNPAVPSFTAASEASHHSQSEQQEDALLQSIHEGGGKMKYIVITLHGPPGAGKTSVKQLLLGCGPLPKELQNSTNIMNTVRTSRITSQGCLIFEEVTNQRILGMVAQKVKLQSTDPASIGSSVPSLSSSTPSENIPSIDHDAEVLQQIEEVLQKVDPSNELFDLELIYLIDTGGQPQFSEILPFLFHHQSLHIVVFRLTDGLNDRPPVRFYQNGQDQYRLPEHLCLTNLEYIERMCEIAEAVEKSAGYVTSVLVIGTHLDKLPEGDERDQVLQKMNSEILEKVYSKYKRYLVLKDKHQVIFPINAMVSQEGTRKVYASEIQKKVLKVAKIGKAHFTIPVKWLALQLDLVKQGSVLNVQRCCARGGHLGMCEEDVLSALRFFKEVGLNLYYPDSGSDLVFTDLDPLINRLSALLKASFNPPTDIVDSTILREKGLFDKKLLRAVHCEEISEEDHKISDDDFLSLLSHLKVVIPIVDSPHYFLPCALALASSNDDGQFQAFLDKEPLVATFNERILPPGFFMMLVIQLLSDDSGILDYNPDVEVPQYRNAVLLVVNETDTIAGGLLSVVDKNRWIEFNYSGLASSCSSLVPIVSHALDKTSEKLKLKNLKCSFCFLCLLCHSNDHTCVLHKCSSSISCSKNPLKKSEIPKENTHRLCWLIKTDEGATSTDVDSRKRPHLDEYRAFSSCAVTLTDSLASHPECIAPLAQRLKGTILNCYAYQSIIDDPISNYTKALKIVESASNEIERDSSLFNTFIAKLKEVGLHHDAKVLEDKIKSQLLFSSYTSVSVTSTATIDTSTLPRGRTHPDETEHISLDELEENKVINGDIVVYKHPSNITCHYDAHFQLECQAYSKQGKELKFTWIMKRRGKSVILDKKTSRRSSTLPHQWTKHETIVIFCVVTHDERSSEKVVSKEAKVSVETLWIIDQPKPVDEYIGESTHLYCWAEGKGPIQYCWFKRGEGSGKEMISKFSSSGVLPFLNLGDKDWGYYTCQAKNDDDFVSSNEVQVKCEVKYDLFITVQPISFVCERGKSATLTCKAEPENGTCYQWYFNGLQFSDNSSRTCKLSFDCVNETHFGQYHCEVRNGGETLTSRVVSLLPGKPLPGRAMFKSEIQFNQAKAQHAFTTENGSVSYAHAKIALLIGNQSYDKMESLSSPHNDVMELKKTLTDMNFSVFAYFDLNFRETKEVLDRICSLLGPGMYLFFYYSGHGFRYQDLVNLDFIIPVDASSSPLNCNECLSTDFINQNFQKTLCKVFTSFDCCRVSRQTGTVIKPIYTAGFPDECPYSNIYRLLSCSPQMPAFEKKSEACSVFNRALRDGLSKKLTVDDLGRHVREVMSREGCTKGGSAFQNAEVFAKMEPQTITLHEDIMRDKMCDTEEKEEQVFSYAAPKDLFPKIKGLAIALITFSFNAINQLQVSTKPINIDRYKELKTRVTIAGASVTEVNTTDGTDFFISGIQRVTQDVLRFEVILSVTSEEEGTPEETKELIEIPLDRWHCLYRRQ